MALSHLHPSPSHPFMPHEAIRVVSEKTDTSLKTHISEHMLLLSPLWGKGDGRHISYRQSGPEPRVLPSTTLLGFLETC